MSFLKQVREWLDHLRGKGPAAAVALTLDLGEARENKPYMLEAGGLIVESCDGDLYAKINGPNGDGINLYYVRRISYPFTSLYLTNTAQPGCSARLVLLPTGMEADCPTDMLEKQRDVQITKPYIDLDMLYYDAAIKKWYNAQPLVLILDDLLDVEAATPSDGDLLVYAGIGNKWVNRSGVIHDRLHDLYSILDHDSISRGTAFPASPAEGDLFFHETMKALFQRQVYPDISRWANLGDFGVAISLGAEGLMEHFLGSAFLTITLGDTGSTNIGYRACRLYTGTTLNSYAIVRPNNDWCFSGDGWYVFRFYVDSAMQYGNAWMVAVYGSDTDVSDTSRHVGFRVRNDRHLICTCGDGTNHSEYDAGYITGDNFFLMYINNHPIISEARFYNRDYGLLTTFTTPTHYLPTAGVNKWLLKLHNNVGAGNAFLNVRSITKTTRR